MEQIWFTDEGKFALLAIENVYTDLPDGEEYAQQLPDGTWILCRIPVDIGAHWKEWIGSIELENLMRSNLAFILSETSTHPHVLNEQDTKLSNRLSQLFYLLQLSGVLEYEGASLFWGYSMQGKTEIRQMSELPKFYPTRGYERLPVNLDRLEQAVRFRHVLGEMDATPDEFRHVKWGWNVLMDGFKQVYGDGRIHQFVRSLEALVLPDTGQTKKQFVHRSQTFAKASLAAKTILEEAFDLRSKVEHLHDWQEALQFYPESDRENIALQRTRQMEQFAAFTYSRILESETIRPHFRNDITQRDFWRQPDDVRNTIWGKNLDLTSLKLVRRYNGWGRALPDAI